MRLRAGTWPWLLAHELRLAVRGGGSAAALLLALAGALVVILHVIAWSVMARFTPSVLGVRGIQIAALASWFVITLVLSTAIMLAVRALYDRGDLDLLISSPLPTQTVFAVRGLGICVNSLALFAMLLLPFANMGAAHGQWRLLAAYPVLFCIGLGLAGLALATTLFLVRRIGARRARVVAQVLSGLIGALLFLTLQIPNLLPRESLAALGSATALTRLLTLFGPESVLSWPLRALLGEPLPMLAVAALGAGLFLAVVRITHNAFLAGTQESVTTPIAVNRGKTRYKFRAGLERNLLSKEWRLLRRDPNVISQTLLQSLYLLPLFFILGRRSDIGVILAPAIIVVASQVAGNLAWLTISAEDAPDLLGSAPVSRERALWVKAFAAIAPVALFTLPFVVFYALRSVTVAAIFAAFLLMALTACALTQIWGARPAPKRDLRQRQRQNKLLNFVEMLSAIGFAGGCYLTMNASIWAIAAILLGLAAPLFARRMRPDA